MRLERSELADGLITCAFCGEHGNWKLEHHAEKKKPNEQKRLVSRNAGAKSGTHTTQKHAIKWPWARVEPEALS